MVSKQFCRLFKSNSVSSIFDIHSVIVRISGILDDQTGIEYRLTRDLHMPRAETVRAKHARKRQ